MKGNLWTVAVLACALALLIPIAHGGFASAADTKTANETTTVDYDQPYTLGESPDEIYEYESFTVSANNTTLTRGTDYLVNESAGELDWQNTTVTSNGDAADVNYTFAVHDQRTQAQADLLATAGTWAGFLVVISALGYIVILMGGGSF